MSQALQSDSPSRASASPQYNQDVLEENDLPGSPCSLKPVHEHFGTVIAKVRPSCKHCTARKEAITRLIPDAATKLANGYVTWYAHDITERNGEIELDKSAETEEGDDEEIIEFFFLAKGFDDSPFCLEVKEETSMFKRVPPFDTSSEASFQFALSCIKTCTQEHTYCGNDSEQLLPTRVLFVGTTGSPTVRLHESAGESSQYVCLSHCWGDSLMLRTTTETVDLFKTQIPWSQLPQTFQDAIYFIRRLGMKYIWIDSLCIIQDDSEDKAREIGKMASVYSNALLTIAATSASNPHEGLFSRTSRLHVAEELPRSIWEPQSSDYGPLYIRRQIRHVWKTPLGLRGRFHDFPLQDRGWAFQERLLSRRVLHFTREELMWECMSASGCECRSPIQPWEDQKRYIIPQGRDTDRLDHISSWHEVIRIYSSKLLTYPSDNLPGLSGLADVWKTLYPDQYLAGLWRSSLVGDLVWWRSLPSPKPLNYLAPSWSWAAYPIGKESVSGRSPSYEELAHISDACCVPMYDTDPTGMVSSGYVRLAAKAAPGKMSHYNRKGADGEWSIEFRGRRGTVREDYVPEEEELDVWVLAMGISGQPELDISERTIDFLVLSSNAEKPETFQRQGIYIYLSEGFEKRMNPGQEEATDEWWTAEEIEWWTSKGGNGWTEFTIV